MSWSQGFSQWLYEDMYKTRCGDATQKEIEVLNCKLGSNAESIGNIDQIAEFLVFTDLAKKEDSRLQCSISEIRGVLNSEEIRSKSLTATCSRLTQLRDTLDNIEYLEGWIQSYERANDVPGRRQPEDERKANNAILENLRKRLVLYKENLRSIRENDPLLGSPTVFDEVSELSKKSFLGKQRSDKEICSQLSSKLTQLLTTDLKRHQESLATNRNKINSKDKSWLRDSTFKRQLWNSTGKSELIGQLGVDSELNPSTVCRMESRYGIGADNAEKLQLIASLGLGFGIAGLGRLAALPWIKRADYARKAVRVGTTVQLIAGTALISNHISEACKEKLKTLGGKKACEAIEGTEFKTLFYRQQEANECLIAASTGVVFAGLSAIGVHSLVSGKFPPILKGEFNERLANSQKANSLADRIEERWRAWDLSRATQNPLPRISESIAGMPSSKAFDYLSASYQFTSKQKTNLAKQLTSGNEMDRMNQVLSQAASGQFVKFEDASWASGKLSQAGIEGLFQFHGTSEKALEGILKSATTGTGKPTMRTMSDVGVYAIPVAHKELSPVTSYWISGSFRASNPEASIVFQGEAAQLFSSPKLPTISSNTIYRGSTTRSPVGNLVIDEYKLANGNLIVTKAHVAPLENNQTQIRSLLIRNFGIEALIIGELGVLGIVKSKPTKDEK